MNYPVNDLFDPQRGAAYFFAQARADRTAHVPVLLVAHAVYDLIVAGQDQRMTKQIRRQSQLLTLEIVEGSVHVEGDRADVQLAEGACGHGLGLLLASQRCYVCTRQTSSTLLEETCTSAS